MDWINGIFSPPVLDAVGELAQIVLVGVIGIAANNLRQKWGIDISKKRQDDLHRALVSGATAVLKGKDLSEMSSIARDIVVREVIEYAKKSVPEAIQKLGADDFILDTLARSKLNVVAAHLMEVGEKEIQK